MKSDLKQDLTLLTSRTNNPDTKKFIKTLFPPEYSRFPEGRINLKTHKSGITPTSIPVGPIISITDSPTSKLES